MDTQNKITATEARNFAQDPSNNVSQQSKAERVLKACLPPALNLAYGLLLLAGELMSWIVLPVAAFYIVCSISPVFGTDFYGELATIAAFFVAAVAGIRGAMQASAMIRSYNLKW